jgi:predicted RNA binding protein YcfA (HicA-like mRNA interferase family)
MPSIGGSISRKELIRGLRQLGFEGPYPGKKHAHMDKGSLRVRIPNPHKSSISKPLLLEILRQAGVSREEWEAL